MEEGHHQFGDIKGNKIKRRNIIVWVSLVGSALAVINIGYSAGLFSAANWSVDCSVREDERRVCQLTYTPIQPLSIASTDRVEEGLHHSKNVCNFDEFIAHFKPEALDITCSNIGELKMEEKMGNGQFRKVHKAKWHGKNVAVKEKLNDEKKKWYIQRSVMEEASVLFRLRDSPYISRLIGWCNSTLVLEYVPRTLHQLLLDEQEEISVREALKLGLNVAKGVEQVHQIGIAHGDIDSGQFLINDEGQVVLGDFNLMNSVGLGERKCSFHGFLNYGAPEEDNPDEIYDEKIDIYHVAFVLWQLRARREPFDDLNAIGRRVIAGERPDIGLMNDYPQEMTNLIVEAWDGDPTKRPSASDLVKRIEAILQTYDDKEY